MEKEIVVTEPRQKYDFTPEENGLYDVIIIGTGVVGWSSAMYCQRLGMKTLVVGEVKGGTIMMTHVVENYPGFVSLSGPELAKRIENHAKDYDIDILNSKVEDIKSDKKSKDKRFTIKTKNKQFFSKTVIFATGTKIKRLGVKGEMEFEHKGVSYCALCDGIFTKGKVVGVVGGSDSAVEEALLLTKYAKKVYIIYRGEKVHPESPNMKRLEQSVKEGKIEVINNTNVKEIKGDKLVSGVTLDKPYKGKKEFPLDFLFIYVGRDPLSELAKKVGAKINKNDEIIIDRNSKTNVIGFFAAGDVTDSHFKQAITGVGEGVRASFSAYECLNSC